MYYNIFNVESGLLDWASTTFDTIAKCEFDLNMKQKNGM